MNKEIKEILDDLRTYKDRYEYCLFNNLSFSDRDYKAKILLDYITNLQEENKNKTDYICDLVSEKVKLQEENKRLHKELTHKTNQYEFLRHRDNISYYENIINELENKLKELQGSEENGNE